jgi:hypothetical protein
VSALTGYAQLDDTELFAERRHVRDKLERLPSRHAERAALGTLLDALTEEFDRRARSAWAAPAGTEAGSRPGTDS